jgi:MFS family permease
VVSLLNDLAGEMTTPLLPLFLVGALAAPVAVVGLVEGAADSTTALLKVWIGHRSDLLRRRKPFILLGYGASAAARPMLALAGVWEHALGARLLDRAGKGVRGAPRDAAIADAVPREIVGRAFGLHRAFDTAGAIGGSAAALVLLLVLDPAGGAPYRQIFLYASIPAAASVLLLLVGFREKEAAAASKPATAVRPRLVQALRVLPPRVRWFILISGLFALGNFTIGLFILRANQFAPSIAAVLAAYLAFNICATALSIPAGILADRRGRRLLARASFLLFAVAAVAFALANSFAAVFGAFLLYGVFTAVWESSSRAYLSELCPPENRATALGAHGTILGLLTLPGSLMAGVLWDLVSPEAAFGVGAALALAAFVAFGPATRAGTDRAALTR